MYIAKRDLVGHTIAITRPQKTGLWAPTMQQPGQQRSLREISISSSTRPGLLNKDAIHLTGSHPDLDLAESNYGMRPG
jgi:hypothetical protein